MLTEREWVRTWPGPRPTPSDLWKWMDATPDGASLEGPSREYALRRGGVWSVASYAFGGVDDGPRDVGDFSSKELFDRWANMGLGWLSVRPSLSTVALHWYLSELPPTRGVRVKADPPQPPARDSNVGIVLFLLVAIMAGLAAGRWLTDTHAPPVSGYSGER